MTLDDKLRSNRTLDEVLKEIETSTWDYPGDVGNVLLAALKKCREQRNEYTVFDRFPIDAQLAADAELLKILNGEEK